MPILKSLRLSMLAMLAVSMWPTQAQASHFNVTFYDQDRYYWDLFSYYWYWNNGTIDAFDGWGRATINGSAHRPTSYPYYYREYSNRGARTSNNPTYGGFRVQARVYVPSSGTPTHAITGVRSGISPTQAGARAHSTSVFTVT